MQDNFIETRGRKKLADSDKKKPIVVCIIQKDIDALGGQKNCQKIMQNAIETAKASIPQKPSKKTVKKR